MDDFLKKLISEALATGRELDEANNKGGNKMVSEITLLEAVRDAVNKNESESLSAVLEQVFADFERKGQTISEETKTMFRESANEAETMDFRDATEFQAALLAQRLIETAIQGKNIISNISGDGINIEISSTMDETIKHPTEYFYESNEKEVEGNGAELLASLCHDLNDSMFTYYAKKDVPAPVEQKADVMLVEKIAIMSRDLTLKFIEGYENASSKKEFTIQYKGERQIQLCITMSNTAYMSTTALMSGIQSIGVEEVIKQESDLCGY